MRKVAIYATIILAVIGASAILPGVPVVREAILTNVATAIPDITVTYDKSGGNAWTGITLEGVRITHEEAGEVQVRHLRVAYYLPAIFRGQLPLQVAISDIGGDIDLTTVAARFAPVATPRIRPVLQDVAIDGIDVRVNGVPFALSGLALDDVHASQTSPRTLEVRGVVRSDFGAVQVRSEFDTISGELSGDIVSADLGFVQTWWPPLVAGHGQGAFYVGNGEIKAHLNVQGATIDTLDLGLTGIDGVVNFAYPTLSFDVTTGVLDGEASAVGTVDFGAALFTLDGAAQAPLESLANWIARFVAPTGLPVDIGGEVDVNLAINGWDTPKISATGSVDGSLLGFPLKASNVVFAYQEDGHMRLDTDATYTGAPLTATMRPAADGTHLRVTGEALSFFSEGDAALSLFTNVHTGYITASANLEVPTEGEPLRIVAELDGVPNEYSLYTDATLGAEILGTGAFAVDGLGHLSGQVGVSLPLPSGEALSATGTVDGTLSEATVNLVTESPARIVVPIGGTDVEALDPRGSLVATLTTTGFSNIRGEIGGLTLSDGAFLFGTQNGRIDLTGSFIPAIAGLSVPVTVGELAVEFQDVLTATGAFALDVPLVPSTAQLTIDITSDGEIIVASADSTIDLRYGLRGLHLDAVDTSIVLGDSVIPISAFIREVDGELLIEASIPAGAAIGDVSLRHETTLYGTFNPEIDSSLYLAGTSGDIPVQVETTGADTRITVHHGSDVLTLHVNESGTVAIAGGGALAVFDDILCFGSCVTPLGLAGTFIADASVNVHSWEYGGSVAIDLAPLPFTVRGQAAEDGALRVDLFLEGTAEPLLTGYLPTHAPPLAALNNVFSGGFSGLDFAGVNVEPLTWDVTIDPATNNALIRLPGGDLHVETIAGEVIAKGVLELAVTAGEIPFTLRVELHHATLSDISAAQLTATLFTAEGTELVSVTGAAAELRGTIALPIDDLARLAGQDALLGLTIDQQEVIRGSITVRALEAEGDFQAEIGNLSASGGIQNGTPTFFVATAGSEISLPGLPPLLLTGSLNPNEPIDATLSWQTEILSATAVIDYAGTALTARVPANQLVVNGISALEGEITAIYDLATGELSTTGSYRYPVGDGELTAYLSVPNGDPLQLRAHAEFGAYEAEWSAQEPTRVGIRGPDIELAAFIDDQIEAVGTAFGYDVSLVLNLAEELAATLTSSAFPGNISAAYDEASQTVLVELTGETPATAAFSLGEPGIIGTLEAFDQHVQVTYDTATSTAFISHDIVSAQVSIPDLHWEANAAYETADISFDGSATGTGLAGTLTGAAIIGGVPASITGSLAGGTVTLDATSEPLAGSTVHATLEHEVAEPLESAIIHVELAGAAYGSGKVRVNDSIWSLHGTIASDILPGARAVIQGEFGNNLVLSASGEGSLAGRLLFQHGTLSGSLELTHEVGTVEAFIIQNEAHITARTPYLQGGSLFSVLPLASIPNQIVLDGLGTIVGEVVVDLAAQHIDLRGVSAHHDVGSLRVNQIIPFAGPYAMSGELLLPPLERPIPIAAALGDAGLRISVSGAMGEAFTVIPTDTGPISELLVYLDNFALPLAGAEALPLTGHGILGVQGGVSLNIQQAATGDIQLVGPAGYVPDLAFHVSPDGQIVATTAGYTFTVATTEVGVSIRESQTGGGIDIAVTDHLGATTVAVSAHHNMQFLAALGIPVTDADISAHVTIDDGAISGSIDVSDVALDGVLASIPYIRVALPNTPLAQMLDSAFELSGAFEIAGLERLELIGNAFFTNGVPSIDLISSTGQQLSGTIWPLDVQVSSVGALRGSAHLTASGLELDELYLELDQARVLVDGTMTFAAQPSVSLLGQIAYRDGSNEYPASLFSLAGEDGVYEFTLGEPTNGVTADINLSEAWELTARVQITDFVMQLPAFEHTMANGDMYISSNSISGSSSLRIGNGYISASGSIPFTSLTDLVTGTPAANAEITVHQVVVSEIPFLGLPDTLSGAISGAMFLRGGIMTGQFIVPSLFAHEREDYLDVYVQGAQGAIEAITSLYGSILTLELKDDVLSGALQLEQFPIHNVAEAFSIDAAPDIHATGLVRAEIPLQRPADLYVRVASEAISVVNQRGEHGSIDISAAYENERLEVHQFSVTGLGTWNAGGVLSTELLDFSLSVQDADISALLQAIPALQSLQPELSGSFEARATGSVADPRVAFSASQLTTGIAGSRYELHGAELSLDQGGVSLNAIITGSDALDGSLAVTGRGTVGSTLFDLRGVELTVQGTLAIPTVGLVDDIRGTINIPAGAAPTIDISGYLGNQINVQGTLAPLDVAVQGSDIRLALPVLMVQDTRLQTDLRLFTSDKGLSLAGEVRADFLTLDPALRAAQLQDAEATGASNPLSALHLAGVRFVVPQRLSFVNSLATIEGTADIIASGPLNKLELDGSASAIRGVIRFSGRDFQLVETLVTFSRSAGIYPHIHILARTQIEKSRITSGRDDITFIQPTEGQTFDIDLLIAGDVTPAPLEPGGFTFDVSPMLTSNALLELPSATGGRTLHAFSNDELLTLAVLGRLDLSSSIAGSDNFGSAIAQGVLDSALDVLIVSELERALKAELGFDLLELRTSSITALATEGAEPFGVSLKVGGYLDDGLFATYQISTLSRSQYGPVLMNQIGLQYDVGPVVFDVAARIYSPNDVTLFETVPELGVAVRYDLSEQFSAMGAVDLSASRFAFRFGVTLGW